MARHGATLRVGITAPAQAQETIEKPPHTASLRRLLGTNLWFGVSPPHVSLGRQELLVGRWIQV